MPVRMLRLPLSWKPWLDAAGWAGALAFGVGLSGTLFMPHNTYNDGVRALFLLATAAGAGMLSVRAYLTRLEYYERLRFVSYEREAALVRERLLRLPAARSAEGALRNGNDGRGDSASPPLRGAWRASFAASLGLFGIGLVLSYPVRFRAEADWCVVLAVALLACAGLLRVFCEAGRLVRLQRSGSEE